MRVGIRVPPCKAPTAVAEMALRAEELGYDQLWFPDSQLLWRDSYITVGVCAERTSSIGLGTAVTNVVTRHPSVVASAARTLAEMAPGRFRLGLGVGNSSVEPIGLGPSNQRDFRSAVNDIRALSSGEEVTFNAVTARMRDPGFDFDIHVAATGPKNLTMSGEIADGAILLSGVAPDNVTKSVALVRGGAKASGRDPGLLSITVGAYAEVTDDVERAARKLKPICAGIAQHGGREFLKMAGIDIDVPVRVDGIYPDLVHAEDWQLAVDRCSEWVSDADATRFAETFCLFGTGEEIVRRLAVLSGIGVTEVFLQHVGSYDLPHDLLEQFGSDVLPRLRSR